jgi:cell division protein FtsQ
MRQYRSLSHILSNAELKLTGLRLDTRGGWVLSLSGGASIFAGRDEVLEKVQRFADFYSHQRGLGLAQIKTVDLRYSNGLAIQKRAAPLDSLTANELAITN